MIFLIRRSVPRCVSSVKAPLYYSLQLYSMRHLKPNSVGDLPCWVLLAPSRFRDLSWCALATQSENPFSILRHRWSNTGNDHVNRVTSVIPDHRQWLQQSSRESRYLRDQTLLPPSPSFHHSELHFLDWLPQNSCCQTHRSLRHVPGYSVLALSMTERYRIRL